MEHNKIPKKHFRYGDNLNPWGDVITMARAMCLVKPGGQALIGVPVGAIDKVLFNAGRIYGPIQLSHFFANWIQVDSNIDSIYLLNEGEASINVSSDVKKS